MQAYKIETVLAEDGTLTLTGLPFHAGDHIVVIVLGIPQDDPLRGQPVRYDNPTEPVAQGDWKALQ
jgi:hypothetical protein